MKILLCESIVYCDYLLIILLIVGVLINNKAFVCFFVSFNSIMTGVTSGAGTANPSGAPEFTSGF